MPTRNGIETIKVQGGKEYVQVAERVKQVHAKESKFEVISSEIFEILGRAICRVTILVDGLRYVGIAEAKVNNAKKGSADETNPFECGETSALGRALAWANFGTVDGIASFDEIARSMTREEIRAFIDGLSEEELKQIVDAASSSSPKQTQAQAAASKPTAARPVVAAPNGTKATASAAQSQSGGKVTMKREPIVKFEDAIVPEITDEQLGTFPDHVLEIWPSMLENFGPYEGRAFIFWLNREHKLPIFPGEWTQEQTEQVGRLQQQWLGGMDHQIYGRIAWCNNKAREDQIAETQVLGEKFGGKAFMAFRNSIPAFSGQSARSMLAHQLDVFIALLHHATKVGPEKLELDAEGNAILNAYLDDMK